jgi:trans-2-enoyl-CoA reductase
MYQQYLFAKQFGGLPETPESIIIKGKSRGYNFARRISCCFGERSKSKKLSHGELETYYPGY